MHLTDQECLKKAIIDTQEKVRDFEQYSKEIQDEGLRAIFKKYAEEEGMQASNMLDYLKKNFE